MRGTFSSYHPLVQAVYFLCALGFCMFCLHPAVGLCALLGGAAWSAVGQGWKKAARSLLFCLVMPLLSGGANMLLNRRGAHVLFRLGGRPFTAEALVFGLLSGLAFAAAFLWFGGVGRVMDTEKILALFGAKAPALTVSFTMVLRFVPRFAEKAREAADAQRGVGFSLAGTPKDRLRGGAHLLSLLTGWALEGTVDAADSMRGRGFGLPGRTSYAARAFERRDGLLLAGIALLALALLAQGIGGAFSSNVFPVLALASPGAAGWGCAAVFYLLPAGMDLFVEGKWNWLRSRM